MTADQTHVIVGASLAGAKAAETLRGDGFEGRVLLIGAEDELPYERPPLSKEYLRGETGRETAYVHDRDFYSSTTSNCTWAAARWPADLREGSRARRRAASALRPPAAGDRSTAATARRGGR